MSTRTKVTGVSNLVDLDLHLHVDRPLAIGVSLDGNKEKLIWLPKSQIAYEVNNRAISSVSVTCTRSLAVEKGLENAVA